MKYFAKEWGVNPFEFEKLPLKFVMMETMFNKELKKKEELEKIKTVNKNGRRI